MSYLLRHPAPLGGYELSPQIFGCMTRLVMTLAKGKVVIALEGGFDLPSICDSSQECIQALLDVSGIASGGLNVISSLELLSSSSNNTPYVCRIREDELNRRPTSNATDALRRVVTVQEPHWPLLKRFAHLIDVSHNEALSMMSDSTSMVNECPIVPISSTISSSAAAMTDETEAVTPELASLTMTHITRSSVIGSMIDKRQQSNTSGSTDTAVVMEDEEEEEEEEEDEDVDVDDHTNDNHHLHHQYSLKHHATMDTEPMDQDVIEVDK